MMLASCSVSCAGDETTAAPAAYTIEQLMDPITCAECHPKHYQEWSGSMHAYAAEDPVFRAMNARGQHETGGELGTFCVQCHAPMAVELGLTENGLNLDDVPRHLQGVTCYFCHQITDIEGSHNNPLALALDSVMRGGIADPVVNSAHGSAYSELLDRNSLKSSDACGTCHDIVNPNNVHLEKTLVEWHGSIFKQGPGELTCSGCHMPGSDGPAAFAEGKTFPTRRLHDHSMPGVDIALTPFPDSKRQRELVQRELDTSLLLDVCVAETASGSQITLSFENVGAGHFFPTGATQDRRVWLELEAWVGDNVVFETGQVADDRPLVELDDPNLIWFGDTMYDCNGDEAHMFWDACSTDTNTLPVATSLNPLDPQWIDTHVLRQLQLDIPGLTRVTARVKMRPMRLDVIDELIEGGWLDAKHRSAFPVYTLASTDVEWVPGLPGGCLYGG